MKTLLVFHRSVAYDSLQPHVLYPARLLCPWHFPGKNIGMGCSNPGDIPNLGIEPTSPTLAGGFFTNEPPAKPQPYYYGGIYMNKMI